jgi:ATP-binding cassette, subfamily B, multidrug efflux pump
MKRLFKILGKKRYLCLGVALAILFQCFSQLYLANYMGIIQKDILAGSIDKIWTDGGIMIGLTFLVFFLASFQNFFVAYLAAYVGEELRDMMFKKVNDLSLSGYNKFGTATLITRTTNDIDIIKNFLVMSLRIVIMSPAYIIMAIVLTVQIDPKYLLIFVVVLPITTIAFAILLFLASPLFRQLQKNIDDVTVCIRENLTGIRVIRAYNQQETEDSKFDVNNKKAADTILKASRIMTFADPIIQILFNIAYIGIFAIGFYLIANIPANDAINTVADISVVAQYSNQIMMSFLMFAMILIQFPQASASIRRINEVLNTKNNVIEIDHSDFDENRFNNRLERGVIEFNDVSFTYPDAVYPSVQGISFKTAPGSITAIIGSTGCGKSSLINLIPRFYDATQGEIFVDGLNIKRIPKLYLRNMVGFIPQQAVLFKGTIRDNIKFGKPDATDEEVNEALRIAQAEHFISKLPEGLDSPVSQSGKNFSGGQKQRLAIARALIRKPEIYVFDDSFSALDFKTDAKLRQDLAPYAKDASVIIVAQRVSSILNADNIIVLDEGKCVGQGTHTELLKSCPVYQDIVKSQLDKDEIEKTIRIFNQVAQEGGK